MDKPATEYWFWIVTDEVTRKRRQTAYRMTEQVARERFGADAMKVEGSREVHYPDSPSTSDFMRRPK